MYKIREDFKLDTMDIVTAVLLGVIQAVIEVVGMLGYFERTVWALGPYGFLFYAGAYLRKRACIVILAVTVTALVRWFTGDPDGPVLLFYALFPAILGAMTLVIMRWRGGKFLFAVTVAVTAAGNQLAAFIGQGGFQFVQGTSWAIITLLFAAACGLIWGLVAWLLGRALEHAGVPSLDKPPAVSGDQIYHA